MPLEKAAEAVADTEDLGVEVLTIIQLVAVEEDFVAVEAQPIVTTLQVEEAAGFAGLEGIVTAPAEAVAAALAEPVAEVVSIVRHQNPEFAVAAVVADMEPAMGQVPEEAA